MSYSLAFRACVEGATDAEFFPGVLTRAAADIAYELVEPPAEVDFDTFEVQLAPGETRHDAVVRVVAANHSWVNVVFLHFDASADEERERQKYYEPLEAQWRTSGSLPVLAPLVPRREMEAWALSDLDAVSSVTRGDWRAAEVFEQDRLEYPEGLSDPKRTLNEMFSVGARSRGQRISAVDYLPLLAERIELPKLRRLSSFTAWEAGTTRALQESLNRD